MSLEERNGKILRSVIVTCHASQFVKNDIDGRARVGSDLCQAACLPGGFVQVLQSLRASLLSELEDGPSVYLTAYHQRKKM